MMNRHARLFLTMAVAAVLMVSSAAVLQSAPQSNVKKINLNTATQAELENLKGIGPALAQKIIAARPFKTVAELKNVSGISQATYDEIKGLVTVRAPRATTTAQPAETTPAPKPKTKTTSEAAETASAAAAGLVNLNTASKAALEALPGVGPAVADRIIAARPFKSVDDLKNVKGIGDARFAALKDMVVVGQEEEAAHPKLQPGQTININTATQAELESLLGIGPVKAQAIIAGRPYAKIEDIMKVRGIKEKTFAKIKDYIVVK